MSELAERLGITRGAFSNNVTKLVALDLIKKEHRGNNQKELFITVTEKGRQEYKKYAQLVYDLTFRQIFSMADELPPESIAVFQKMIKTFADTLV